MEVHGRVQVNVCDIQELCVEDAGAGGRSHTEGCGRAGRRQVQPLHRLPRRLAEGHAHHPLNFWAGRHLGGDRRQRRVHQLSVGQKFVSPRPVLGDHFKKRHFPSSAKWTSEESLQVTLGDVTGRVVVRELGRGQVFVVSVKPRDEEAGTPWGHSNVRYNFVYTGPLPLFSGVSWHLLRRNRRGGRVTAGTGIWSCHCTSPCWVSPYLRSLWARPGAHPSADSGSAAGILIKILFLQLQT